MPQCFKECMVILKMKKFQVIHHKCHSPPLPIPTVILYYIITVFLVSSEPSSVGKVWWKSRFCSMPWRLFHSQYLIPLIEANSKGAEFLWENFCHTHQSCGTSTFTDTVLLWLNLSNIQQKSVHRKVQFCPHKRWRIALSLNSLLTDS